MERREEKIEIAQVDDGGTTIGDSPTAGGTSGSAAEQYKEGRADGLLALSGKVERQPGCEQEVLNARVVRRTLFSMTMSAGLVVTFVFMWMLPNFFELKGDDKIYLFMVTMLTPGFFIDDRTLKSASRLVHSILLWLATALLLFIAGKLLQPYHLDLVPLFILLCLKVVRPLRRSRRRGIEIEGENGDDRRKH